MGKLRAAILYMYCKRLFSQLVSVLLLHLLFSLYSCVTSHSFPVGLDSSCYYPSTMFRVLLFYLRRTDDDDYRRLIVYGCERETRREKEREKLRKRKRRKKENKHAQHSCSST